MNLFLSHVPKGLFLFIFSFSFLEALDFTKEEKDWIGSRTSVIVGVDNAWEPFDFINDNGKHDGMSADYLQIISEKV
ncbi:MAG TPA: hypothetical protein EYG82_02505 [Sulfurovum sp.]|nr:hypothetical protein [Sulfurovum sp.]